MYNIPGFTPYHNYRTTRRGGGVSLHVKESLKAYRLPDLDLMDDDLETIFLKLRKESTILDKSIILCVCYRPPSTDINDFTIKSNNLVQQSNLEQNIIYMMGDFNINLLDISTNHNHSHFYDTMVANSCIPLSPKPTRCLENSNTLIDNLFTNNLNDKAENFQK